MTQAPGLALHKALSHENGGFRNWWYADLYDDLIVLYSPFRDGEKGAAPVKAWRRYSQVWRSEANNSNGTSLR